MPMDTYDQKQPLRVLVLHNTLSPYRIVLFKALAESEKYIFKFLFYVKQHNDHKWEFPENLGFDYSIMDTFDIKTPGGTLYFIKDLSLFRGTYDLVVISDHINIPETLLQIYAKIKGIPILRWTEATKLMLKNVGRIKRGFKALLNKTSDAMLVPGAESREYVQSTTKKPIYTCNNVVDNELFAQARNVSRDVVIRKKEQFGLQGVVISFFGQFVKRKGVEILIKALDFVQSQEEFSLLLVGDGILKNKIFAELNRNKRYKFFMAGYVDQNMLPTYYAISDIVVLPSYLDVWGMVVNESIAAGVPVICSDGAGASRDLIHPGESGLIFPKEDVGALASAIETMLSSVELRRNMVVKADKILENYTVEKAKDQFLKAINSTYRTIKAQK
ncbi:MAG: glycosyltransferase family 4 protein [Candidatus Omnitrophica bacterium]|nr:glycosyltransferase family 4 protein [Candidatus Omnitrophota bacterium]